MLFIYLICTFFYKHEHAIPFTSIKSFFLFEGTILLFLFLFLLPLFFLFRSRYKKNYLFRAVKESRKRWWWENISRDIEGLTNFSTRMRATFSNKSCFPPFFRMKIVFSIICIFFLSLFCYPPWSWDHVWNFKGWSRRGERKIPWTKVKNSR